LAARRGHYRRRAKGGGDGYGRLGVVPLKGVGLCDPGTSPIGWSRIRTCEGSATRFTVWPLWPLGYPPESGDAVARLRDRRPKSRLNREAGRAGGESRTHNRRFTKPVLCRLSYASVREAVEFLTIPPRSSDARAFSPGHHPTTSPARRGPADDLQRVHVATDRTKPRRSDPRQSPASPPQSRRSSLRSYPAGPSCCKCRLRKNTPLAGLGV
jgi:hypothetical protein